MINNLSTPSSEQHINFGELQIDAENSATGEIGKITDDKWILCLFNELKISKKEVLKEKKL